MTLAKRWSLRISLCCNPFSHSLHLCFFLSLCREHHWVLTTRHPFPLLLEATPLPLEDCLSPTPDHSASSTPHLQESLTTQVSPNAIAHPSSHNDWLRDDSATQVTSIRLYIWLPLTKQVPKPEGWQPAFDHGPALSLRCYIAEAYPQWERFLNVNASPVLILCFLPSELCPQITVKWSPPGLPNYL